MKNWLKRHFIPHVGNAYRPHFLLGRNVAQLLGLVMGIEFMLFILPTFFFVGFVKDFNLSAVLPAVLSTLTNEKRLENNLPQLIENPLLVQVAQLKAEDMAGKSYFAHTSPEGITPWYWFKKVGYQYAYAGENLAVNFSDSEDVTEAWVNSPGHRANIVGRNYKEMGTGIATGQYKGRESVFVVQVYASPRSISQITGSVSEASIFNRVLASPHQSVDVALFIVLVILLASLVLNIFVNIKYQHKDLIINGTLGIMVIIGLYFVNGFISREKVETSFMAFESTELVSGVEE